MKAALSFTINCIILSRHHEENSLDVQSKGGFAYLLNVTLFCGLGTDPYCHGIFVNYPSGFIVGCDI
jgi:hypothetical protein